MQWGSAGVGLHWTVHGRPEGNISWLSLQGEAGLTCRRQYRACQDRAQSWAHLHRGVQSSLVQLRALTTQVHPAVAMELMSPEVCFFFFNLEKTVFMRNLPVFNLGWVVSITACGPHQTGLGAKPHRSTCQLSHVTSSGQSIRPDCRQLLPRPFSPGSQSQGQPQHPANVSTALTHLHNFTRLCLQNGLAELPAFPRPWAVLSGSTEMSPLGHGLWKLRVIVRLSFHTQTPLCDWSYS